MTERCNLRCAHCYQDDSPAAELGDEALRSVLAQFRALLAEIGRRSGAPTAHITLTGGEPFVRAGFRELLEEVARERQRWSFAVLTNGTTVDRSLARQLAKLGTGFVQVSLEGTPETHDRIRGAGSHARAVAGLRHLVRARVPTMVSFTARRDNWRELPSVIALARALGVGRVWSDRMIPLGHGERDQVLGPEETRELVALLARERAIGGRTEVAAHRALQFPASGGRPYRCSAGIGLLTVLTDGTVVPCRRMPVPVGDLRQSSLSEIWFEAPYLQALREPRVARGCEGCFHERTCGGGLRCLSAAVHGEAFVKDPGCWLNRRDEAGYQASDRSENGDPREDATCPKQPICPRA